MLPLRQKQTNTSVMDIKSVITSHGYSVNSLAKKMDVWQSALSTLVNGKNPTIGKLKEMATALDCSWLEFFKDEISIEDLRRSFPELMAQQAAMSQPATSEEPEKEEKQTVEQAKENDQASSDLTADVAIICPHCHEAIKLGFVK